MTIGYTPAVKSAIDEDSTKQCAVLLIRRNGGASPLGRMLAALGFQVAESSDLPEDDRSILDYHVVIVSLREIGGAPMIAARVRAKPHFGRRVLIAVVPASVPARERVAARASGFDDVATEECDGRELAARILRCLRSRPEFDCVLPRRGRAA